MGLCLKPSPYPTLRPGLTITPTLTLTLTPTLALTLTAVWDLSRNSAGLAVEFETNAPHIEIKFLLGSAAISMYHMASTAVSGVDLYLYDDVDTNAWRFVSIPDTAPAYPWTNGTLVDGLPDDGEMKRFRLHLPLHNSVNDVILSIGDDYSMQVSSRPLPSPSVLWYGSSIAQGAVASRPGTAFTNSIRNRLGVDVLNFGFSGNVLTGTVCASN